MKVVRRVGRLVLVATGIGLTIAWIIWAIQGLTLSDSDAYRLAAERLISGADIYQAPVNQDEAFRYAPWFAAAWVPIAALPEWLGDGLWAGTLFAATVVAVMPLAQQPHPWARLLAVLGGSVLFWTAARGNVHPLVILALVHGLRRSSGPVWIALAASLKAVPILFTLIYVARRDWWRVAATLALTAVLVVPMPLMGWDVQSSEPGPSLSLFALASPAVWAVVALLSVLLASAAAVWSPRLVALAAGSSAVLVLPRLLLYDLTYLLVSLERFLEGPRTSYPRVDATPQPSSESATQV